MKRKIKQRKYNLEDLSQVNISVIVSVDNTEARDRLKKTESLHQTIGSLCTI